MTELSSLWLPILVSSLVVFFASSVIHMAPLWHRGDYPAVPDQDRVMDALRPFDLPPGDYLMPRAANRQEMQSPEYGEKMRRGPVAIVTVVPTGPWSMGAQLTQWLLYTLAVSVFAAYVAGRALPPGADYIQVFRFAGTTAFLSHAVALWQMSIWYKRGWSLTLKATLDGLIYALLMGGVFGAMWPG